MSIVRFGCLLGFSAGREVLLGFAPANLLYALSFADVLDEDTGRGYQRRFNSRHSLDFRRYIQAASSSTIPLTFNLRPRDDGAWRVVRLTGQGATLIIDPTKSRSLAQVDCQHRLGHLNDLSISLPFMCFVGLAERDEMEVFNTINGKAHGLSRSLIDFHDAHLASDLGRERPELLIALYLNNELQSPWHRQLDLGGTSTSGLTRRASLRTMQKATKRFLTKTKILKSQSPEVVAVVVRDFWAAIAFLLPTEWAQPRKHLLTKGIGVYALMELAADLVVDAVRSQKPLNQQYFVHSLTDFVSSIDWSSNGALRGLGGEAGVKTAVEFLRSSRRKIEFRVVS